MTICELAEKIQNNKIHKALVYLISVFYQI